MYGLKKALFALSILLITTIAFAAFDTNFLYIETDDAGVSFVGIRIKLVSGQTVLNFPFEIVDSDENSKLMILGSGHIQNLAGINTEAAQYGSAFISHSYGQQLPEHTNGVGSYDHTGGTQEALFTKTSGDDFTQADANTGTHIVLISINEGATAEIKSFIDADNVIVDGCNWTGDFASQVFWIFKHPSFNICDGDESEISVDGSGKFEKHSYDFTGPFMEETELDAAADNIDAQVCEIEVNGYNNIIGKRIRYVSGDLQPGDVGANQVIEIDDSEAVGADATTQIAGSVYIANNASAATKDAIVVLPGFTRALDIFGAEAIDPAFGYETTSTVSIDRVNSGGAGNDAFINPAVNEVLLSSNGDNILIGSPATFEIIQVFLAVASSKDLEFDFYYSVAGGGWTLFDPQADNTNGFLNNGSIVFSAASLVGWSADDEDLDGNAITNALYILLERTYAPVVGPNHPTESHFKIYASQSTGSYIDGQGFWIPRLAADADAPNRSIYESTDAGVLVFKDSGGVVRDLYTP